MAGSQSLIAGADSWVSVPMGHLSDPLNIFWQLLSRRGEAGHWTLVTPPGVASNGGIALAASPGSVLASIAGSGSLRFSVLASTTDGGASWSPGLAPGEIPILPSALGMSDGRTLAVLSAGRGSISVSSGKLKVWRTLVTGAYLARSPAAASCDIGRLTAVTALAGGATIIGTSCRGKGAGIFELSTGMAIRSVGPPSPDGVTSELLRLDVTGTTLHALIWQAGQNGESLVNAQAPIIGGLRPTIGHWSTLQPLFLGQSKVIGTAETASGTALVLRTLHGAQMASSLNAAGRWTELPVLPRDTRALSFGPAGQIDAFVVKGAVLRVEVEGPTGWRLSQQIDVPIEYGSSGAGP